mgnify:CR=1 FL=1
MKSAESGQNPSRTPLVEDYLSRREQRMNALSRLKKVADDRRFERTQSILSQEGESLLKTVFRVFYLSACVLFDGLVLTEIIVIFDRTAFAWLIFIIALVVVVFFQRNLYDTWFSVDISQRND